MLNTRDYSKQYLENIISLFNKTFGHTLTKEYWNWRFENNSFGKPIIRLCFDDERLIAVYLVHPIKLEIENYEERAVFSMFTMTDPEYSGRGIITKLANEVFDIAKKEGFAYAIGFANENSRHVFTKKLGFRELAVMQEMTLDLPCDISSQLKYEKINFFDNEFSDFYEQIKKEHSFIMIPRKKEYLNWRFFLNPDNTYECYKIIHKNKLAGYFVLKNYHGEKGHIVDFLTKNEPDIFANVLVHAIDFCNRHHLPKLTLWANPSLSLYKYFLQHGFYESPMETFFIQNDLHKKSQSVKNFSNWYITMSDSDVF